VSSSGLDIEKVARVIHVDDWLVVHVILTSSNITMSNPKAVVMLVTMTNFA